jgi:type III secretion system (T3SS) SseB-like protein
VPAEPLNRLEKLLRKGARNPTDRIAFQRELLRSHLYVVCQLDDHQRVVRLVPAMVGGELVMPAYTAKERILEATNGRQSFVQLPTLDILRNLPPDQKLVINQGAWDGVAYQPDEIKALLAQVDPTPTVIPSGTEMRLGHSEHSLEWLIAALTKPLNRLSGVQAAHVALIEIPSTGEPPHPIVGLRLTEGTDIETVMRPLMAAVDETSRGPVDFVPIGNDGTSVWLLDNTEPFFQRPLS